MIAAVQFLLADDSGSMVPIILSTCCGLLIVVGVGLIPIIGIWKVFAKAGEPGVAAIVPIWNLLIISKISGRDPIMGLVLAIPCVGTIFAFIMLMDIAKRFGKEPIYGIGLALLPYIFWPMLGFGSAQYIGDRGGARARSRDDY